MKSSLMVLIALIIVIAGAAAVYWYQNGQAQSTGIPPGKYILLEHKVQTLLTIPGDSDTSRPYAYLGYPTYSYNQSVIAASNEIIPPINDRLKVIYEYGSIIGPGGCHGASFNMSGVYGFPYASDDGMTVLSINSDGTAYLTYDGKPVILGPKETWYDNRTTTEDVLPYNANSSARPLTVNVSVSDRIVNYGIFSSRAGA